MRISDPHVQAELKRRSAIEPVIGHLKDDHGMERNYLKGRNGDRFNVEMSTVGFNFRRVLAWLRRILCRFLETIIVAITSIWQFINDKMENENRKYQTILQTADC